MIVSTTFCDSHPALARFRKRPPISKLPLGLQRDIREFFGTYKAACEQADQLLFQAGRAEAIDEGLSTFDDWKVVAQRALSASLGRRVARTAAAGLRRVCPDVSRRVEAHVGGQSPICFADCANGGQTPLVKLHRVSGKVSYLSYPDFETDPHPALARSVKLNLRTRELDCWDYFSSCDNPPILYRKEKFLPADHPLREKFARLTRQEEQHGLLDETATIGNRNGWNARLEERGFAFRGHRLVRRDSGKKMTAREKLGD